MSSKTKLEEILPYIIRLGGSIVIAIIGVFMGINSLHLVTGYLAVFAFIDCIT